MADALIDQGIELSKKEARPFRKVFRADTVRYVSWKIAVMPVSARCFARTRSARQDVGLPNATGIRENSRL